MPPTRRKRWPSWSGCTPSWSPSTPTSRPGATRTGAGWPRSSTPGSRAWTTRRPGTSCWQRWRSHWARCDAGYDDTTLLAGSPFLIQGPLFNAIWRWSAGAVAEIARLVGEDPAPHRADARRIRRAILDQLWDRQGQRFGIRDVRRDQRTPEDTIIAFSPLLDPALPRPMVDAITGLLGSPCFHPAEPVEHYLVPTYDLRAPGFDPRRYWRGPVWINTDATGQAPSSLRPRRDETRGSLCQQADSSG